MSRSLRTSLEEDLMIYHMLKDYGERYKRLSTKQLKDCIVDIDFYNRQLVAMFGNQS